MKTSRKLKWLIALVALLAFVLAVGLAIGETEITVTGSYVYTGVAQSGVTFTAIVDGHELTDNLAVQRYSKDGTNWAETFTDAGQYYIEIRGDYVDTDGITHININQKSSTAVLNVAPASLSVSWPAVNEFEYTGEPVTVSPTVTGIDNPDNYVIVTIPSGAEEIGDNYSCSVTIKDEAANNVEFASAESASYTFKIIPAKATITWPTKNSADYTGSEITVGEPVLSCTSGYAPTTADYIITKPSTTVQDAGSYEYSVAPTNDSHISLDGQSTEWTFTVNPLQVSIEWPETNNATYAGSPIAVDAPNISANGYTIVDGDYQITTPSSAVEDAGTYEYKVTINNTNLATSDPLSWTFTVNPVKVKAGWGTDGNSTTYTGNVITVDPVVEAEGYELTKGTDYSVEWSGEVKDAKSYTVTVTLQDTKNFTFESGTGVLTYNVVPAEITEFVIDESTQSRTYYPGKVTEIKDISATVKAGDIELIRDKDYELSSAPSPIEAAGDYQITIMLPDNSNFTKGSIQDQTYTVNKANLAGLTLDSEESIYNQKDVTVTGKVYAYTDGTSGDTFEIESGIYTLSSDPAQVKNAGEYEISATVNSNNYTGDISPETYTIKPASLGELTLGVNESIYAGQSSEVGLDDMQASVSATAGEEALTVENTAYNLVLEGADKVTNAGEYTISIELTDEGKNNYEGTIPTAKYTVKKAEVSDLKLDKFTSIYNQVAVDLTELNPVLTAGTLDVENDGEKFTLHSTPEEIKDQGDYTITVTLDNGDSSNFLVPDGFSRTYTITKADLNSLTLGETSSIYDSSKPVDLAAIQALDDTVVTAKTDSDDIILPKAAYKLVPASISDGIGKYTITVELVDTNNYTDPSGVKAEYEITAANLASLTLEDTDWVYNQETLDPNTLNLNPTVKDEFNNLVETEMYQLTVANMKDAGEYQITVTLTEEGKKFYQDEDAISADFKVLPAVIKTLTLGKDTSVYNRKAVEMTIDNLKPTLIAVGDKVGGGTVDLTVPTTSYTMISAEGDPIDVGDYTISPVLNDDNYTDKDSGAAVTVTDIYTITAASLKELKLDPSELIYRKEGYDPEKDLKDSDSKASVTAIGNGEDDVFDVPLEDVVLSCDKTILDVGTYTITATPITENYVKETTRATELTIKLMQVDPIVITVNGMQGLVGGENRLGGPNEGQYHSFSLSGEPNEPMTVTVSGDTGTIVILKVVSGDVITIKNNAITFEGSTLNLDTTGDVMYTITANYDDASNLKVGDAETAAAPVSETFYYDVSCKPGTVTAELMNRGETGISIDAAEDYSSVELQASGENNFFASASNVPAGGNHIPFAAGTNTKLFSTEHNGGNTYGGTFTDLLGNTANIDGQTIGRSNGTLSINSVEPAPNENGWISKTNNLNWSISMSATGGFDELTIFSIGGHTEHPILKQGDNSVPVDPNSLTTDAKLPITISFDDLNGNATYQSIGYDKQADMPLLTTIVYDGCNILGGIAEPGMSVTISVNGESVTVRSDRWGFFVTDQLPLAYEGDVISIHYVDKAGNYVNKTLIVGEAQDPVKMDAYMLGKLYSNSHFVEDSANAKWVNILNVSMEDLQNGRVAMPIIAGNIVKVGEIEFSMDANNTISYTYTLNDGINQLGDEVVMVDTKRNMDALLHLQGEAISPNGTVVEAKGKNPTYSLVAKFEVEVPADLLQETFQTANENDNALKRMYVERQTQRSLKDSE